MKQEFKVTGMTCAACSAGIQKTVGKMKGVRKAEVSLMGEKMQVDYDESSLSSDQIIAAVEDLGYGASVKTGEESAVAEKKAPVSSAGEEAKKLKHRFLASLCFLVPLLYFTMGHMLGAPLPSVPRTNSPMPSMSSFVRNVADAPSPNTVRVLLSSGWICLVYVSDVISSTFFATPAQSSPFAAARPYM